MKFDTQASGVNEKEIHTIVSGFGPVNARLVESLKDSSYISPESFIRLPHDEATIRAINEYAHSLYSERLRYIFIVGIGGSSLGAQAIYDALFGYADVVAPTRYPKMIFVDTLDLEFDAHLKKFLAHDITDPKEIAIIVITKSGITTETIANMQLIFDEVSQRFKNIHERSIIITDEGSPLWKFAHERMMRVFAIPKGVGGRFSVFSCAGLLPLALCGIHIHSLCEGARNANMLLHKDTNDMARSAATTFVHYKKGVKIHNSFFFHAELESLGHWWRQLIGESLGKIGLSGKPEGIVPEVSIGTADLHSVGQMYLAGSQQAFTTFIYTHSKGNGHNTEKILHAILEGVKRSYADRQMPFVELCLSDVSEKSIGEYMQFKMIETVLLADLMKVNAFDQPNVEAYKAHTRKILGE